MRSIRSIRLAHPRVRAERGSTPWRPAREPRVVRPPGSLVYYERCAAKSRLRAAFDSAKRNWQHQTPRTADFCEFVHREAVADDYSLFLALAAVESSRV